MPLNPGQNQKATRRSTIAWAIFGAVTGVALAYCATDAHVTRDARYWMCPVMFVAGAAIGVIVHLTDGTDEDDADEILPK